jgi:hypothetical protein
MIELGIIAIVVTVVLALPYVIQALARRKGRK